VIRLKDENKAKVLAILCIIGLFFIICFLFFVVSPEYDAIKLKEFENNQEMKRGVILLVIPNDAVYFKDGSIMKLWQRGDYDEFRNYIGMEVTITYGEIKNFDYVEERKLFKIVETPIGVVE